MSRWNHTGVPANCLFSVQVAEINDILNRGLYHPLIISDLLMQEWSTPLEGKRLSLSAMVRTTLTTVAAAQKTQKIVLDCFGRGSYQYE